MSAVKKYHKLEFSALEDELLIEKVKENPPLYAKKLKSYKDMKMKDNIWAKIAREMGESGYNRTAEECKKRWTNLRDYYMRKKRLGSTGTAASGQRNEKLDQFMFLDNTALVHKATKSNVSATTSIEEVSDDNDGDEDVESGDEETATEESEQTVETHEMETTKTQEPEVSAPTAQIEKISRKAKKQIETETHDRADRKRARTQVLQDIQQGRAERMALLRNIAQRAITPVPESTENHIDLFFKSLAATAKTLSPWYLAEAKRKLFHVMAEIEEKNMQDKYRDKYEATRAPPLLLTSTSTPSPSLTACSDDSASSFFTIGHSAFAQTDNPSHNTETTINNDTLISSESNIQTSDYNIQNFISSYTPL